MFKIHNYFSRKKQPAKTHTNLTQQDIVTFGITLASASVGKWQHTCQMLEHTLTSVIQQSDPRCRILICGHEKPAIKLMHDPRIEFLVCKRKAPKDPGGYLGDRRHKRALIGIRLRELGGGYFIYLDADDLMHQDIVKFILENNNKKGYSIRKGYVLDYANKRLAPVPGAWDATFDQVCGSCAVFYFKISDLPVDIKENMEVNFFMFKHHAYWRVVSQELGQPFVDLPFSGAIYTVNHSQNISFTSLRNSIRQKNIIENIKKHQIANQNEILENFGLTLSTS